MGLFDFLRRKPLKASQAVEQEWNQVQLQKWKKLEEENQRRERIKRVQELARKQVISKRKYSN